MGIALTLVTGAFSTADGYSYAANADAYKWNGTTFAALTAADAFTAQNTSAANQHTNVGDIYFFTAGNYALINESSTGSIAQPISRSDSISLSFSKPINPGTFSAVLNYNNAAIADGNVRLSAAWSADAKQVTLTADIPSTGIIPGFPYSSDGTRAVGTLQISGKAADGSSIFANTGTATNAGIPVYTTEGVKLIDVDVALASVPTSRTALSSQAIKLSFSKPLNTITSKFNWNDGSGNKATDFTFADSNATVYVWTDLIPSGGAQLVCNFAAEADPFDTNTKTIGNTNEFTKAPTQQKLILESTNIYDARLDPTRIVASEADFPVSGNIVLNFSRAIPPTASIWATLSTTQPNGISAATPSPIALTTNGKGTKTLTIDPANNLYGGRSYYVAIHITNGTDVIFSSMTDRAGTGYDLNGYDGIIVDINTSGSCQSIAFKTAPIALTNAWANGAIGANETSQYSFNVTAGTQYWVWWNDSEDGDGSKTGDVTVTASYLGGTEDIFSTENSGWTTPQPITPTTNSTVILKVTGGTTSGGTFGITYNTSSTRPQG